MKVLGRPLPQIAPLLLNGYALVLNAGMTALLGIVFWMVATRLYSQEQVGLAAALISAMTTISYFSQMNLSSFLTRFLPTAGAGAGRLILRTYGLAGLVSALAALLFASGVGFFAEPLQVLRDQAALMAIFVAATVLWTIFALQDAALSGLRRATLVPASNTVYALAKIGLLLAIALLSLSPALGIFFAWTLPLLPIILVVNALIQRGLATRQNSGPDGGPDLRSASRFWGWDFAGSLALGAAFGLAPLMITASAGVAATASYHLAWSFAYSIYLLGRAMSTSLVAEGAIDPIRLRRLIADSLTHTLLLVLGGVLVILIFAPLIMGLFGSAYVQDGAPVLRLLALSCLPWAVTTLYCAAARVRRRTHRVAIVQIATLAVFLAVSAPLVKAHGAQGVAFGWLVAHSTLCIAILVQVLRIEGRIGLDHWLMYMAGSAQRLASGLPRPAKTQAPITLPPDVTEGLSQSPFAKLIPAPVKGGLTDVSVFLLGPREGQTEAVLKCATSAEGSATLERNARALHALSNDPRLAPHATLLPHLLLKDRRGDWLFTVETAVPGRDGRAALHPRKTMAPALAGVAAFMADLHHQTATRRRLDEAWAQDWIDQPIATLAAGAPRDSAALAHLQSDLRTLFLGREMDLGLGHGDLWPGNLFFSNDAPDSPPKLSGLIDWDTYRDDAPAALDTFQLCLALRMAQSGEELGPVLRGLLLQGRWGADERAIFTAAAQGRDNAMGDDPALWRGLLLLTWLRHVAMVIGQSEKAATNRFWWRMNVDLVLGTLAHNTKSGAR